MKYHINVQAVFIFLVIVFCPFSKLKSIDSFEHHVICSLKNKIKNQRCRNYYNKLIHEATYKIKQQCKSMYQNSVDTNDHYAHRRDTVFFIHFDHNFYTWTLYKPSFIPYEQFIELAKKTYGSFGLQVEFQHDKKISITKRDIGFDNEYLTLDEFETYKNMDDATFTTKITKLHNKIDSVQDATQEIETLQKMQKMQKLFFWHLKIPTTGILPGDQFDIQDAYKPLAWHFLLWDLAPKKGEGAHVAIIDTGISAFNLQEQEFSDIYKKNINITMPNILQTYGYNLVSENGLDPIRQIAINFGHYCDHTKFNSDELMQKLPEWILEFVKNKNKIHLEQYFIKNAKKTYLDKSRSILNKEGEKALKDLLNGKYGITPLEKDPFFHIAHLKDPYNQAILLETLPAPKIIGNEDPFAAGHGTFTQGVVNGKIYNNLGISGLAPHAQVTMIKAFHDSGTTNKTTLNAALQRAIVLKNPIVSMSLKITDEIDTVTDAPLKALIDSIDYVVAASGNDGTSKELANKEAYPAKFDSVAFDVGAFQYDRGTYPVCSFTQKELEVGPKFVAPGFDILSAGLTPDQTDDSMYVFMAGTSIAVPVITGFLALVLAEFQDVFTREQILKVIYKFSMKLNHDDVWQKYIKLGTPDMRSTLLCLHVLQSLQNTLKDNKKYLFQNNFDNLIQAIYTINYHAPQYYGEQISACCINNFAGYAKALEAKSPALLSSYFIPSPSNVTSCVQFIANLILTTIDAKKYHDKKHFRNFIVDENKKLLTSLQTIIATKKINLFVELSPSAQKRINCALTVRTSSKIV